VITTVAVLLFRKFRILSETPIHVHKTATATYSQPIHLNTRLPTPNLVYILILSFHLRGPG